MVDKHQVKSKSEGRSRAWPDEQEIKKRLKRIIELDSENGKERVCLLAARIGLRFFPLVLTELSQPQTKGNQQEEWLGIVWRALIVAWGYNQKSSIVAADAIEALYPHYATELSAIAITIVAGAATATATAITTDSSATSVVDHATDIIVDASAVVFKQRSYIKNTSDVEGSNNAIKFDFQMIENPDFLIQELRRTPLWPESKIPEFISELNWQNLIENWVSERSKQEENPEIQIISKISHDYEAILKGDWINDGHLLEEITIDIADEKPQQDTPSAIDYLGRDQLVNALVPRLSVKNGKDHLTIGLFGDWGIGKSSVIEQLREKLDGVKHCDYLFGEFNAWSYEHTVNLQAGIAHEVISALTSSRKNWSLRKRLLYKADIVLQFAVNAHGKRILFILVLIWLTTVYGSKFSVAPLISNSLLGIGSLSLLWVLFQQFKAVAALPLAKEFKTYLRLPSYQKHLGTIPEMEKNIKTLCDICLGENIWGKNRRLVFFVDDLDRCGVDGIVKTFEAVRLVLDIPWVTVVIAMDQRIALPALAFHYEKLAKYHQRDSMSIARDYLAKVIHLPIQLQAPDDLSVARYLAYIWNDSGFVTIAIPEQGQAASVSHDENLMPEEAGEKPSAEKPRESMQDIIDDINSMDIKSLLQTAAKDEEPKTKNIKENQGFGDEQKIKFYQGLIDFNLRNPRQIKRLYNSYNLLWSIYADDWEKQEDAWYVYMLSLLILEMVNEHVAFDETVDIRAKYRQAFFDISGDNEVPPVEGVNSESIKAAQELILAYQKEQSVDLLARIDPFVLPVISPQDIKKT